MYHSFFILASVHGHLCCLHVMAIVNIAAVKIQFSSVAQSCLTLCDAPDRGPLAPLSMGFSRQEYWSGLPCLLVNWLSVQFSRSGVSCDSLRPLGTCQGVCSMPDFPVHYQLLELAQIHVHRVSDATQHLCRPLLLLPSIFPSIRAFSNESVSPIRWPKYWSFSMSPSNEYSVLISFRIDWVISL